jgi:hypothetical protein
LDAVKRLDPLPKLNFIEGFVKAFDDYLLNAISGPNHQKCPILYKTWLKSNAKMVKSLLASRERGKRKRAKSTPAKDPTPAKPLEKKQAKRKASGLVNLAKYEKATKKRPAASGGVSAVSASAPPVSGSDGASAASASAPPELAAASGDGPAASASAPPVQSATIESDDEVGITGVRCMMMVKDILEKTSCDELFCTVCKRAIDIEAIAVVTEEGARHQTCLDEASAILEAANTSPMDPLGPQKLKAAQKVEKASKMEDATDIDEDTANMKHDALMEFGSKLKQTGYDKNNNMHWNIKYEPTKKRGSWRNTRHAVVLRWSNGTSKTEAFCFKEHQHSLEEFKIELEKCMNAVIKAQTTSE